MHMWIRATIQEIFQDMYHYIYSKKCFVGTLNCHHYNHVLVFPSCPSKLFVQFC